MQKYKLVFKSKTDSKESTILLKGINEEYCEDNEVCFIDAFTSAFEKEQDCLDYLKQHQIISEDGILFLKRPNGTEIAADVIYASPYFRTLILEVCKKKRQGTRTTLSETMEYKKVSSEIVSYLYQNDKAASDFEKSFFLSKSFITCLKNYISYKNHDAFYTPYEMVDRERNKDNLFKLLKNYEILRAVKLWIEDYKNPKHYFSSSRKNPFEEYENKKDEREENQSIL